MEQPSLLRNSEYLVISATLMEIKPLLDISKILSDHISSSGIRTIKASCDKIANNTQNTYNQKESYRQYDILITGPGVINTAHGLTVYLERYATVGKSMDIKKLKVIQTGISGFFKDSNLRIGDIAVATSETYIHTGVCKGDHSLWFNYPIETLPSEPLPLDPLPLDPLPLDPLPLDPLPLEPLPFELVPSYPFSRQSHFSFDNDLVQNSYNIIQKNLERCYKEKDLEFGTCQVVKGDFITVSSITASCEQANFLFRAFKQPYMESMEGAAAAHITTLYNIPLIEVRAGSNPVGVRDKSQWDVELASQRASFSAYALIC